MTAEAGISSYLRAVTRVQLKQNQPSLALLEQPCSFGACAAGAGAAGACLAKAVSCEAAEDRAAVNKYPLIPRWAAKAALPGLDPVLPVLVGLGRESL